MAATQAKIIEYLQTIETTYTDARVVSEQEHRALVWFFLYGQNVFSQIGHDWRGASFRQQETMCLLTVKGGTADTPLVAYISGHNPIGCVLTFCKRWHADTVEWHHDRYA